MEALRFIKYADALQGLEIRQKRAGKILDNPFVRNKRSAMPLRMVSRAVDRAFGLPKIPMHRVTTRSMPLSTCQHSISLRTYQPRGARQGTLVYFHGGGCVVGDLQTHDRLLRYLAHYGEVDIVAVDYRLAPEYPFPEPIYDAIDAWNWINKDHHALEIETSCIGVGGDSAGAYLAALVGLRNAQNQLPIHSDFRPDYQLLIYPMMDLRGNTDSYHTFDTGLILTNKLMDYFKDHYLKTLTNQTALQHHPLVNPVLIEALENSPASYVLTVEFDPLKDCGIEYVKRLQEAGVAVTHEHISDCMHAFPHVGGYSPRAKLATQQLGLALKQRVATAGLYKQC